MIQDQLEKLYQLQRETSKQIEELKIQAVKIKAIEELTIVYSYLGELEKDIKIKEGTEQDLLAKYHSVTLNLIKEMKEGYKKYISVKEERIEGKTIVTIDAI